MAVILLMTLLVPVVVWIAVRLENGLDSWDRAAAVRDQPSPGETNGTSAPEQTRPEMRAEMGAERERIAAFGRLGGGLRQAAYWHWWGRSISALSAGRR